jgi:cytoskeletal protein CcmA (bactofilin family)
MASVDIDERRVTAWIGHGVVIEGRITSAQDLRIDGKVEGTIEVGDHGVVIGQSAEITADLAARSILISGSVVGDITAAQRVELKAGASVEGDITAPRLVIADGAIVNGTIDTIGISRVRSAAVVQETVP